MGRTVRLRERRLGGVLEAIYADSLDQATWLGQVSHAFRHLTGTGGGVATTYRWHPARAVAELTSPIVSEKFANDAWMGVFRRFNTEDHRAIFCGPPVNTMRTAHPADWHLLHSNLELMDDANDLVGLFSLDADGEGVLLTAASPNVVELQARDVQLLGYLAAHLTCAYRARRRGGAVEAVLTPGGAVAHAEPRAQASLEPLRSMVRCADQARSSKASPAEALAAWTAVVQGRWSLVETVESDGRRFFLARENEPKPELCAALEAPELSSLQLAALTWLGRGYALKAIAYELGLSPSRISRLLSAAGRALGLTSRAELVRVARAALSGGPCGHRAATRGLCEERKPS